MVEAAHSSGTQVHLFLYLHYQRQNVGKLACIEIYLYME